MLCSSSIEGTSQHESSSLPVYSQQQISIEKACPKYLNELEALEKHGWLTVLQAYCFSVQNMQIYECRGWVLGQYNISICRLTTASSKVNLHKHSHVP